jgi:putative transposase
MVHHIDKPRRIRPKFVNNEIYHIYNRGVDKRDIFMGESDYIRFVHDLYEFNDTAPAKQFPRSYVGSPTSNISNRETKERLMDILCWCLMPNHFHLMVRQRITGGISAFMQKLGTGYTNAFNITQERSGVLFQGKFKAEHVNNEPYFLHLPFYIHANPLDLAEYGWKTNGIKNIDKTIGFLENYRWSSYPDYIGKKNFPSLLNDTAFVTQGRTPALYKNEMSKWLKGSGIQQIQRDVLDDG